MDNTHSLNSIEFTSTVLSDNSTPPHDGTQHYIIPMLLTYIKKVHNAKFLAIISLKSRKI